MSSPISITSLNSDDTDYRGSNFFSNRKKEYIQILDTFIGKKSGIMSRDVYKSLIALSKTLITLKRQIDRLDNDIENIMEDGPMYTLNPADLQQFNDERDRLKGPKIQKRKEKTSELQQKKGEIKSIIQQNLETKMKNQQNKDVMKKVMDKLYFGDKLKKEYDIRIVLITINYVLYMSNSGSSSALWKNPNGKKAESDFFKSFEKFFTPEEEDEDNEDEILSNFHESLLHVKEKYKVKLLSDDNEDFKFYKLLLSMNRYAVNTTDIETMWDEINFVEKSTSLQNYLKKPDNIIIQIRGQYKIEKDANGNNVKKPQYAFTKRSTLKAVLRSDKRTYYGCKEREEALIPRKENVDKKIKFIDNKDVLIGFGNKFWDISIINEFPNHQIFVLQNLDQGFASYASVHLAKNVGESSVVSGWHCQIDAPKGTAKLLLGVADSNERPSSPSPLAQSLSVSPLSDSSASNSSLSPPVRRRRNPNRREIPRASDSDNDSGIELIQRGPGRPRGRPPRNPQTGTRRRGRPPINRSVAARRGPGRPRRIPSEESENDFMDEIMQQAETNEDAQEFIRGIVGDQSRTPSPLQQQDAPRRGRPRMNTIRNRSVGIGGVCERDLDCINDNCVNNVCTRRARTTRGGNTTRRK